MCDFTTDSHVKKSAELHIQQTQVLSSLNLLFKTMLALIKFQL